MILLGFGNKARNGKDTAAEAIVNYYNKQNESRLAHVPTYKGIVRTGIFKYATALYQEVNQFLTTPIGKAWTQGGRNLAIENSFTIPEWVTPEPNAEKSSLAPYGKHPKLLQFWGTEFRRNNFGQDYWVKRTFASIPANLDFAFITDVRFPNEAEAVEARGGYTVNVKRLREDGTQYTDPNRSVTHVSETALDNWNWKFRLSAPEGHVAWLQEQAIALAEYLKGLHAKS